VQRCFWLGGVPQDQQRQHLPLNEPVCLILIGVPTTTGISIVFVRPPGILELQMEPAVEIGRVDRELYGLRGDKVTFYPARPLQPDASYTVAVNYGQEVVQPGFCRTSTTTWQFTTGPE